MKRSSNALPLASILPFVDVLQLWRSNYSQGAPCMLPLLSKGQHPGMRVELQVNMDSCHHGALS
jgi:hypothetical protein